MELSFAKFSAECNRKIPCSTPDKIKIGDYTVILGNISHKRNADVPVSDNVSEFLDEICNGNADKEQMILSILGRCINTNNYYGECVFLFTGEGRTTLCDFITDLVGDENRCNIPVEDLRQPTKEHVCICEKLINVNKDYKGYILYEPLKRFGAVDSIYIAIHNRRYTIDRQLTKQCKTILCVPEIPMQLGSPYYNVFKLMHHVDVPKINRLWVNWSEDDWSDLINRALNTFSTRWSIDEDLVAKGKEFFTEMKRESDDIYYKTKCYREFVEYSNVNGLTTIPRKRFFDMWEIALRNKSVFA